MDDEQHRVGIVHAEAAHEACVYRRLQELLEQEHYALVPAEPGLNRLAALSALTRVMISLYVMESRAKERMLRSHRRRLLSLQQRSVRVLWTRSS